jgi:hypothetical protein
MHGEQKKLSEIKSVSKFGLNRQLRQDASLRKYIGAEIPVLINNWITQSLKQHALPEIWYCSKQQSQMRNLLQRKWHICIIIMYLNILMYRILYCASQL